MCDESTDFSIQQQNGLSVIRHVFGFAHTSYHCELLGGAFVYFIRIVAGRKTLQTSAEPVPQDLDMIRDLIQDYWKNEREAKEARGERKSWAEELGPYETGNPAALERRLRRQTELDTKYSAEQRGDNLRLVLVTKAIEQHLKSIAIPSPLIVADQARYYALHKNRLWSSTRMFSDEQWLGLIANALNREEARLTALTVRNAPDRRLAIPSSVRVEVWKRDGGRCSRCDSRERLEFDHIIPLSLGGSNTSRNIELLCEMCNRAKAASIS